MSIATGIEAALKEASGWPRVHRSWRDDLAADYEIAQARLQVIIESSEVPQEYL